MGFADPDTGSGRHAQCFCGVGRVAAGWFLLVLLVRGERLFGETSDKKPMHLINSRTLGDGLVFLTYQLVREA